MIDRPLYVDKIMAYVDTPFVKILTGVRRCGKSTILKMIMERLKTERNIPEDRIISCRFDSMEYEDMTAIGSAHAPDERRTYNTYTPIWKHRWFSESGCRSSCGFQQCPHRWEHRECRSFSDTAKYLLPARTQGAG